MGLVDSLIAEGWLKTPEIIEAFRKIKRVDFLPAQIFQGKTWAGEPDDMKDAAELNEALPIGFGQTISQPLTVAFMMELLEPGPGQKVLDIGCGSGWTTALLSYVVNGDNTKYNPSTNSGLSRAKSRDKIQDTKYKGKVVGVEIVPELAEFGRGNVAKYGFLEKGIAEIIYADGSKGYGQEAPYDRILVSASVQKEIPQAWKEQLKPAGRLVCPVNNSTRSTSSGLMLSRTEASIWLIIKRGENDFEEKEFPGFVFVPLV